VQVDPMKPQFKLPGTKRLKPNCDILLSTSDFKFNLRRYGEATANAAFHAWSGVFLEVGRCRLTL